MRIKRDIDMPRKLSSVRFPRQSYGECKVDDCNRIDGLANGWCQFHWDLTLDNQERRRGNARKATG